MLTIWKWSATLGYRQKLLTSFFQKTKILRPPINEGYRVKTSLLEKLLIPTQNYLQIFQSALSNTAKIFNPLAYRKNDQLLTITETNQKIDFSRELWDNPLILDFWYDVIWIINIYASNKLKLSFAMTMKCINDYKVAVNNLWLIIRNKGLLQFSLARKSS